MNDVEEASRLNRYLLYFSLQKQQRELTVRHARETERDMKKRLDVQKDEYEDTIKRHLSFIDQVRVKTLSLFDSACLLLLPPYLISPAFVLIYLFDIDIYIFLPPNQHFFILV